MHARVWTIVHVQLRSLWHCNPGAATLIVRRVAKRPATVAVSSPSNATGNVTPLLSPVLDTEPAVHGAEPNLLDPMALFQELEESGRHGEAEKRARLSVPSSSPPPATDEPRACAFEPAVALMTMHSLSSSPSRPTECIDLTAASSCSLFEDECVWRCQVNLGA